MPAIARKEAKDTKEGRTVRVVAITHAFQDLHRYRRGDELEISLSEGQRMPAWCVAADDVARDREGRIKLNDLPLFFPASSRDA